MDLTPVKSERFQDLLANDVIFDFARRIITESYLECVPAQRREEMQAMLAAAFDLLARARADEAALRAAIQRLTHEVFRKSDPDFWFSRVYADYKRNFKPQRRFQRLQPWLIGHRVLDLGCGNGLLARLLSQQGYEVALTDVMDYRDPAAQSLPFRPMTDARRIPYPDDSFDTVIAMTVLHHVAPADLEALCAELRRVGRRVVIEEDSYDLPADLPASDERLADAEQLRAFRALPAADQLRYTMFLDYFANALAQGLLEMDFPFDFKSVRTWQRFFVEAGFEVQETILRGFQRGQFHRNCHVWFILEVGL